MERTDDRADPYRLPRSVIPSHYELELVVDPERSDFTGSVRIHVEVREPVRRVVLNSLDLDLRSVAVTTCTDETWTPTSSLDVDRERATLHLDRELPVGHARIDIDFAGRFCESLVGLYRSAFTVEGAEAHLAVTQFESTHARRAFPCFDEPDMKATFGVRLVVPGDLVAVSNGAETAREPLGDGTDRVTFSDTIVMSTYLVAMVVGPLTSTATRLVTGVERAIPLRVVCPPGSEHLGEFALDVADAGLRFFEDYYGLAYPGDKVDLVAVPDFAFGAMENLGCITFREVALLVDPDDATQPELQRVADVVNHELAHMWFGDLVTMSWWEGIWLNEAFATFMEVMATDSYRPDWDAWTGFGLTRAAAFDTDSLRSTRPIEFPVTSPAEAEAMFDVLTYEKGASIVRMLEQYLGAETFRDGIRDYLATHSCGNTRTGDLWDAIEQASGEPVRRIMDAWIHQGGHPVVVVEPTDTGLELSQRPAGPYSRTTWSVPMVVTTTVDGLERRSPVLLEDACNLDLGGTPTAVRVNTGGNGFFRCSLPSSLWATELAGAQTTPLERVVVIDDLYAALLRAEIDDEEVASALRLGGWRETDPSVWRRIAQAVCDLRRLRGMHGDPLSVRLAHDLAATPLERVQEMLSLAGAHDRSRWQDVRGTLVSLLGVVGADADARELASEVFHGEAEVDASLATAALDVVAATGDSEEHAMIERRWRTATTPQETIRHLHALADTPIPDRFDHVLELTLSEVRAQDSAYVLRRALGHRLHADRAWAFVTGRWDDVVTKVPASSLVRMLEGVRTFTDPQLARSVVEFSASHPLPSGELVLAQHLERMWITVAAAERTRCRRDAGSDSTAQPTRG